MFIGAHLAAGLIIGKITNNYPLAIASAILVDADHLIPYFKHRIIFKPKKLWRAITNESDPYGNQRNFLHSFFSWFIISAIILLIDFNIGIIISLGYLSNLLLDLLDNSEFYPFYPLQYKIVGPVKYLSRQEIVFTAVLFVLFFII